MRARLRDDRGSTIPLIVCFAALGLAIILGMTAATSLFIERKRLLSLADGAALSGAEAWDLDDVDSSGGAPHIYLRDRDVSDAVEDYLAAVPQDGLDDLVVESADAPDGVSARVRLSAVWRPPVVTLFLPDGLRIDVSSTSRSVLR